MGPKLELSHDGNSIRISGVMLTAIIVVFTILGIFMKSAAGAGAFTNQVNNLEKNLNKIESSYMKIENELNENSKTNIEISIKVQIMKDDIDELKIEIKEIKNILLEAK